MVVFVADLDLQLKRFFMKLQRFVILTSILIERTEIDERISGPFDVSDFAAKLESLLVACQRLSVPPQLDFDLGYLVEARSHSSLVAALALDSEGLLVIAQRVLRFVEVFVGDSDRVQHVCLRLLVAEFNGETQSAIQGFQRTLWATTIDLHRADGIERIHVLGVALQSFEKVIARGIKRPLGFVQSAQVEMDLRIGGQGPGQIFVGLDGLVQIVYDARVIGKDQESLLLGELLTQAHGLS